MLSCVFVFINFLYSFQAEIKNIHSEEATIAFDYE